MNSIIEIRIDCIAINQFLDNHWNGYLVIETLAINTDKLMADTVEFFTSELLMSGFQELHELDKLEIRTQIKEMCNDWLAMFGKQVGNSKFITNN